MYLTESKRHVQNNLEGVIVLEVCDVNVLLRIKEHLPIGTILSEPVQRVHVRWHSLPHREKCNRCKRDLYGTNEGESPRELGHLGAWDCPMNIVDLCCDWLLIRDSVLRILH